MAGTRNSNPFSDWETIKKLGEGSFGSVYEIARTLPDGKKERAALKTLSVPQNAEEIHILRSQSFSAERITAYYKRQMENLVNEYIFMQELSSCPNVVSCQDVRYIQHTDGIGWDIYIRMELLTPLRKVISQKYDEFQVLRLGMDICRALMACESKNIIHRDIKPGNILVSPKGQYKLADFGIAKVSEKTETGTLAGTNEFMAPEVANRQHYGKSVDIYSLGMVLYWMMNCNTIPFLPLPPKIPDAETRQAAIEKRLDGQKLPTPHNGSRELKQVILKACSFDPQERFQSAREFGAALQRIYRSHRATDADGILQEIGLPKDILNSGTIQDNAPAVRKKEKKKKSGLIALGVTAVLATAVLAAAIFAFARKPGNHDSIAALSDANPVIEAAFSEPAAPGTEATEPQETVLPYQYESGSGGICITGWDDTISSEAVVPEEIDGVPVTEIAPGAFSGCKMLTTVTLPDSVATIGEGAFSDCSHLADVQLPTGLEVIPPRLFSGCTFLGRISLPVGLGSIGEASFENCQQLAAADLPEGITEIGNRAFNGCEGLTEVFLPDSLKQIGTDAFRGCKQLYGIDIPENILQIGEGAFYESGLFTATVPAGFTNDILSFFPEECSITYYGFEKPKLSGEVGDIITFGHYEQDNDLTNGPEEIEWLILDKNEDGSRIYVISQYGLDSQQYYDVKGAVVTWETSKIRTWLNQTFYAEAFNPAEQSMIVTSNVMSISPRGSYPSREVQDRVFLLDYEGSYGYFENEKARTCYATDYAASRGSLVQTGGKCWWWLREGYFVDLGSIPNCQRANLTDKGGTVRPVMWIDMSA